MVLTCVKKFCDKTFVSYAYYTLPVKYTLTIYSKETVIFISLYS